jgi:hypothetical protein
MRKLFWIPVLCALVGCALAGGTNVRIQGNDLKTPYGTGSGNINVNSRHCWSLFGGKCASVSYGSTLNSDVTNEYIGSAGNSSK